MIALREFEACTCSAAGLRLIESTRARHSPPGGAPLVVSTARSSSWLNEKKSNIDEFELKSEKIDMLACEACEQERRRRESGGVQPPFATTLVQATRCSPF